jgi:ABC-type antimicrobial peptide transport system permease subunit
VVNELFAKKFFPGRAALGQAFETNDHGDSVPTSNRVVGVVANANFGDLRAAPSPQYFVPVVDHVWPYLELVVRPTRSASGLATAIARVVDDVAPGIAQSRAMPLSASIDDALSRERMSAQLGAVFGAIALGLVAVGLYGILLFQVAERTTEIGIRVALGAPGNRVVALVLRQSLSIIAIGVGAGVPLALLAGRAIGSQLYGVQPYSAIALTVASMSLVAVAVVASLIPVRRALGVDPLTALRAE